MQSPTTILGADAARYVEMIDALALDSLKTHYAFTTTDQFGRILRNNPVHANQIYWSEILARSHLTAVAAVLRSRRWIAAVVMAAKNENLLAFAAALRGLIESAADASTALEVIPRTLARDHALIIRALSGALKKILVAGGRLEDELIHFSYARHLTKAEIGTEPPSHRARRIREYIEILEKGEVDKVVECYRTMCDLTHPGMSSVWMWLHLIDELEIELAPNQEGLLIEQLLKEYQKTFLHLLMFAFNPAIVTLKVLLHFPAKNFHVPALGSWNLSDIPLWNKCVADLKGAPLRIQPPLRFVKPNHTRRRAPQKRRR